MIEINSPAPAFSAVDQDGKTHALADYAGTWLLLYFYPKDDTPGCTAQACDMRDNIGALQSKGISVLGVSVDSLKSHRAFAEKYQLSFPLLSDEEKKIVNDYEVWRDKSMYGKSYKGTVRTSFLIDPAGLIRHIEESAKPATHVRDMLAAWEKATADN